MLNIWDLARFRATGAIPRSMLDLARLRAMSPNSADGGSSIPTADNLTGVWVFSDNFSISMLTSSRYTVTVTIGTYKYTHTAILVSNNELCGTGSKNGSTWLTSYGRSWRSAGNATWDFGTTGQTVPADFYAWLTTYATYQG